MKSLALKTVALVLAMALLLGMAGCGEKEPEFALTLTTVYNGATVSMENPIIAAYMDATDEASVVALLEEHEGRIYDYAGLKFAWEGDRSYTYKVYFAEDEHFKSAITFETSNLQLNHKGVFMPGKTYWWKVESSNGGSSMVDSFTLEPNTVRYVTFDQAKNVRDGGGWKTEDGKTVKYGMIYRGGKVNPGGGTKGLSEYDHYVFEDLLGINCEIDLRTQDADDGGQMSSVFGYDTKYVKASIQGYTYIFPDFQQDEPQKREFSPIIPESLKKIFEAMADESNYPIYYHCNAGADRTGTVAFLLNGLLGVSREDLTRDFELTSFSKYGQRSRSKIVKGAFDDSGIMQDDAGNYVAWDYMIDKMLADYGTGDGKLSSAIENYLITVCELEQSTIDQIRTIMLEG
ncbi:MAG: tyrosine-protein phosphatase [Clostridia bacterium]|nr:tyrosine-protein phosphatase [Clostridia bacterium]